MPPTIFQTMLDSDLVDKELLSVIAAVQAEKETAVEGEIIEAHPVILDWIQKSIQHFEATEENYPSSEKPGWEALNAILKKWTGSNSD